MSVAITKHAQQRGQQRGIGAHTREWLLSFGARRYDHQGGVTRFFDPAARRRLSEAVGEAVVRQQAEALRSYLVQDARSGLVITVGKLYRGRRLRVR